MTKTKPEWILDMFERILVARESNSHSDINTDPVWSFNAARDAADYIEFRFGEEFGINPFKQD